MKTTTERSAAAQKAWETRRAATAEVKTGNPLRFSAKQFKVVCLREAPLPEDLRLIDVPEKACEFWRQAIETDPRHQPEVESFYVLMLNTRRRIIGFRLTSTGTLDTLLVHAREVFRAAIVANAAAVILMHNHPSGDSTPSEADIKVTRDLVRAGQLLKIEVLDHVIVGRPSTDNSEKGWRSLRELGYFC
jgi:DNA repair protein RadC